MNYKKTIPLLALSLFLGGCSTIERALLNSEPGKQAALILKYKYTTNFGKSCKIEDFGFSDSIDTASDKPIFFFLHGWGGNLEEFLLEEKKEPESKLSIMNRVYEGRVLMADYPSSISINNIFSGLEKDFLEFIDNYSKNNSGKKPKFILAGHSLGSQISRMFARKYPEYISKVGIIAGVNNGLDFGQLTPLIRNGSPKYMEQILIRDNKFPVEENYQSVKDITMGSEFMNWLNTPTPELDTEYNFYVFLSKKDNPLIPGKDDGTASMRSAYPTNLIKRKKFENVKVGEVMFIKGDVDHCSINNLEIFRKILESLKSEKKYFSKSEIIVPKCPPLEEKIRKYEEDLKKEIKF